jgi:hypothetical protein
MGRAGSQLFIVSGVMFPPFATSSLDRSGMICATTFASAAIDLWSSPWDSQRKLA